MQCERYRNYCVLQCILLAGVSVFKERTVTTVRYFLLKIRAQTSLKMRMLHVLGVKMCKDAWLWHTANEKCYVGRSKRCLARFRPCSKVQCFTGRKGCSKRNAAVIVRLFSVFARSEAVYDMHFVPLRAVFLHQGSRKGHRLRPTGRSVSGTWMHVQYEHCYGLGMDGLVMGCS